MWTRKTNLSKIPKAPKPTCIFSMSNYKMISFFRSNTQSSGCNSVKQFYILATRTFFSVLSFHIFSNALICPWNRHLETLHALNISTLKKAFSTSWDFMCHLSGTRACKTLREMAPCPLPPFPPKKIIPRSKILLQVIPQPPQTKRRVRPYKQHIGDLWKYLLPFQLIQTSGACIWILGISSSCIPNRS